MKVAITGHTQGIGKAIFDELNNRSYQVQGYSRSNGWNISLQEIRSQILAETSDFDVFINNAYSPIAQFELLKLLVDRWQGTRKLIVNVGSKSIYADVVPNFMQDYVKDKQAQLEFINSRRLQAQPQILNLTLGLVDTQMSSNLIAEKLAASDVAATLIDLIEIKDRIYVQDLMLDVPFQDWKQIKPKG
jgi:putative NADH-flavin reductase